MDTLVRGALLLSLLGGISVHGVGADSADSAASRADAYFNFSMGHIYAEQAAQFGNRGEYLSKAIEFYKAALKADPNAAVISEELAGLYIQAGKVRDAVAEIQDRLKRDPNAIDARRVLGRLYARMIGDPQTNKINEEMLRLALEQYRKIVEIDPKDTDSWLLLGRLQRVAHDSVESEKAFKKVLELDPDNEDALTELALVYANLGDSKMALQTWEEAAKQNPNRRNLTALAGAYEDLRDYANAVQVLRRALDAEPDNLEIKRMLGQDLIFAGKFDEALKIYSEVVADDPKDSQSLLRMSQVYRQQRNFAKAHEILDQAKALEPDNMEILYGEVSLLDDEGRHTDAINAMKQLVASTEKSNYNRGERASRVALLERLALLYRSNEQYKLAVETFQKMAETDPDVEARVGAQVVETYRQGRDFNKAMESVDAAVKKFPTDRMLILTRATLLADMGKGAQALEEARKAFRNDQDKESWLSFAQICERAKNWSEMAKALDAYEKLATDNADKSTLYFMRGSMEERLKKYDVAETQFRKALAIEPDNASVLNYLGYMLADRNVRLEEAHKMITRALELDPGNGAYLDSLGWVYFRMDRLQEAEDNLRRSLEEVPHDATVRDHLGDVLAKRGKLKEAIVEWQTSLKEWDAGAPNDRDSTEIAKIGKKLDGARVRLAQESPGAVRKP